ncbi:putative hydrolase or acyltransferase of alpha/beta superfamily [Rhizobium leguminosarum bv. trifolii WSM2297]|uniref:Putative hydrolase or acyltransferase of alpha/beta superfamily n=1 Tax=Rhizobium leguminosarum bv. trifolii WSM2297 TaxID=754762 RepID=J0CJ62_RHILT|nr:alpha/beta hydrolase [Rhizobium leguminosarum]EJC83687.1 putative hydrolase or acyltransferase of alpha/beta superfamily [Rhizobium leguminosarum bv. trifolii WSM2297]EJC84722.1 putative hydrolase or acyltransferase of alpha/beta superfamily [Rhizobium leguminosarum bv. trifolii WSM2297]
MRRAQPFETSDGTILNVDMAGEGASAIFQHGLCGDAAQTDEVFPLETGFRRITVEARGHGRSGVGNLEQLSISTFCDDIAAYNEKNLAAPVVIGGISMGAAIALRLAVKRPDLVKALIVARPAWLSASAPENMAPNAEVGRLLKTLPAIEAGQAFLAGPVGRRLAAEAPDNLASLAGFFSRTPLGVTAELLTRISNDGPGVTDADICNLTLPTLVIGHDRDSIHPLGHARALAERIAGARFVQITPKAESRPQYVADFRLAVGNFLKEL